jgi:hypothetical protein
MVRGGVELWAEAAPRARYLTALDLCAALDQLAVPYAIEPLGRVHPPWTVPGSRAPLRAWLGVRVTGAGYAKLREVCPAARRLRPPGVRAS